jgi:hypothetical protein
VIPLLRVLSVLLPTVVAAAGTISAQPARGQINATELSRISGADQDLSAVNWVVGFPDGRIAVGGRPVDGTIRWFDAGGRPSGRFGRSGEGPGEFRTPVAAGRLGDTLWVLDRSTQRATLIRPGNPAAPTFSTLSLPPRLEPSGNLTVPVIGSVSSILTGRRLFLDGIEFAPGSGSPSAAPRRLVTTDSTGRVLSALPPLEPLGRCQVPYAPGKGSGSVGIFFCAQPIIRVSQAGDRIAVVTSDNSSATQSSITVRLYSADAQLIYEKVLRVPARPIPRQVADSIQQGALERARSPEARDARSRAKIPPAYPPVMDVVMSDGGAIWLSTPGGTPRSSWIVLDARGARQADVLLPKSFRPLAVIGKVVIGTEVDPNDFIDIVRYRVGP